MEIATRRRDVHKTLNNGVGGVRQRLSVVPILPGRVRCLCHALCEASFWNEVLKRGGQDSGRARVLALCIHSVALVMCFLD